MHIYNIYKYTNIYTHNFTVKKTICQEAWQTIFTSKWVVFKGLAKVCKYLKWHLNGILYKNIQSSYYSTVCSTHTYYFDILAYPTSYTLKRKKSYLIGATERSCILFNGLDTLIRAINWSYYLTIWPRDPCSGEWPHLG